MIFFKAHIVKIFKHFSAFSCAVPPPPCAWPHNPPFDTGKRLYSGERGHPPLLSLAGVLLVRSTTRGREGRENLCLTITACFSLPFFLSKPGRPSVGHMKEKGKERKRGKTVQKNAGKCVGKRKKMLNTRKKRNTKLHPYSSAVSPAPCL